ncbi:MAG TPA: ABC transporter permease [Syntrophorhabdales bacterium]|nr:ABC transporter permease [Syntrophorhabdales bacterium]
MHTIRRAILETRASGALLLLFLIVLWEILPRSGIVYARYFPPFSTVMAALFEGIRSTEILKQASISIYRAFCGYCLAILIGVTLGTLTGTIRWVSDLLEITIELLRPMPSVALVPIAILLFGTSNSYNISIITFGCTWPILVNTYEGAKSVDTQWIDTARIYGATRSELLRKVVVPAALPYIVSGLRISLATSIIIVTVTEMLASFKGLGFFIMDTYNGYRIPQMYSGIITIGLVGYALNRLFMIAEERFMAWHKGWTAKSV